MFQFNANTYSQKSYVRDTFGIMFHLSLQPLTNPNLPKIKYNGCFSYKTLAENHIKFDELSYL